MQNLTEKTLNPKFVLFYLKQFSTLTPVQLEETYLGFLSESKRLTHKDFSHQLKAISLLQSLEKQAA